jgi:hypothetical protein
MEKPIQPTRFPTWLRGLGWLAFGILTLVALLLSARWLLMHQGHRATLEIVKESRKKPLAVAPSVAPGDAKKPGLPLSAVPHFGKMLTADEKSWRESLKEIGVFWEFLNYRRNHPEIVDGVVSFRAILKNLGAEVPDSMTEEEAAAAFLKKVDSLSALIAQWREAVANGPFAQAGAYPIDKNSWRLATLSFHFSRLLGMTAEAHLQTGNAAAAWEDMQTLKNSSARLMELFPGHGYEPLDFRMHYLAESGLKKGIWTDAQLSELSAMVAGEKALASARADMEREKRRVTEFYSNFRENQQDFGIHYTQTPEVFDQMVNQVKLKLITDQQIRDNLTVHLHDVDQRLSRFDPETGYYKQPTEQASAVEEGKPGLFGNFYFLIRDMKSRGDHDWVARDVIGRQSHLDQFRIAAALETYQRQTGDYPEHLDALGSRFPDGLPQDIATGQPYFYQRDADGYTLWGTGIDGTSERGDPESDISWKQRRNRAR